jgi:hypothetical protein
VGVISPLNYVPLTAVEAGKYCWPSYHEITLNLVLYSHPYTHVDQRISVMFVYIMIQVLSLLVICAVSCDADRQGDNGKLLSIIYRDGV